ncbi:hypothetical protein [Halomonas sp. E19]|uniref:hypothetical protein n=1 Tax=Halomonas sp. E19 TaxID=3397247 RepID=UPI004033D0F1
MAREVVKARAEAVDDIEAMVDRLGIDCQFKRQPAFRLLNDDRQSTQHDLNDELDALISAGLDAERVDATALPFDNWGIRISNQAQFNPCTTCRGWPMPRSVKAWWCTRTRRLGRWMPGRVS